MQGVASSHAGLKFLRLLLAGYNINSYDADIRLERAQPTVETSCFMRLYFQQYKTDIATIIILDIIFLQSLSNAFTFC